MSFFGLSFEKFIDIEDSEEVLRAIKLKVLVVEKKINDIDDQTLILADIAKKAMKCKTVRSVHSYALYKQIKHFERISF